MFGKIGIVTAGAMDSLKDPLWILAGFPTKMVQLFYHKSFRFILTDEKMGLVNFVDESVQPIVREVSALHQKCLDGQTVTDEEWAALSMKSDQVVADRVNDATKEPVSKIMSLSTREANVGFLRSAADTLIMLITMAGSQSAPSAAAAAICAFVPGGKITQGAVHKLIYGRLASLMKP